METARVDFQVGNKFSVELKLLFVPPVISIIVRKDQLAPSYSSCLYTTSGVFVFVTIVFHARSSNVKNREGLHPSTVNVVLYS